MKKAADRLVKCKKEKVRSPAKVLKKSIDEEGEESDRDGPSWKLTKNKKTVEAIIGYER